MIQPADPELARGFVLQGFDRQTDVLRIELHLELAPLERLRALFDVRDDAGLYDAYPVDAAAAQALSALVSEPVDTERYDFFLQRYA